MEHTRSLSHTKWECKYHIVWIPKYRKKTLYGHLRQYLGELFKELAAQKECDIIEGHLLSDHVHINIFYTYDIIEIDIWQYLLFLGLIRRHSNLDS